MEDFGIKFIPGAVFKLGLCGGPAIGISVWKILPNAKGRLALFCTPNIVYIPSPQYLSTTSALPVCRKNAARRCLAPYDITLHRRLFAFTRQ
jgi:hypothetical protein